MNMTKENMTTGLNITREQMIQLLATALDIDVPLPINPAAKTNGRDQVQNNQPSRNSALV
jgi:hypothetical protein